MANRQKKIKACLASVKAVERKASQHYRAKEARRRAREYWVTPAQTAAKELAIEIRIKEDLTAFLGKQTNRFVEEFKRELIRIWDYRTEWCRSLKDWKPSKQRKGFKLFRDLLEHLFVAYTLPSFMYKIWRTPSKTKIDWFLLLAKGENIGKAIDLPIPLTKKMIHHFPTAPGNLEPEKAMYWSWVIGLGGSEGLALRVVDSEVVQSLVTHFDFWKEVILYFVNHDTISLKDVRDIISYIHYVRFDLRDRSFSIKRRAAHRLIAMKNEWREEMANQERLRKNGKHWRSSNIKPYECIDRKGKYYTTVWSIRELTSEMELTQEGQRMSHCVGGYTSRCMSGYSTIWSLRLCSNQYYNKSMLTIEVSRNKQIVQVRGRKNALPKVEEMRWVKLWAKQSKLTLPPSWK